MVRSDDNVKLKLWVPFINFRIGVVQKVVFVKSDHISGINDVIGKDPVTITLADAFVRVKQRVTL